MFYRVTVIDSCGEEQQHFFKDMATALYEFFFDLSSAIEEIIEKKELTPDDFGVESWEEVHKRAFNVRRLPEYVYFEELRFEDE